jgi:hypothetical protein
MRFGSCREPADCRIGLRHSHAHVHGHIHGHIHARARVHALFVHAHAHAHVTPTSRIVEAPKCFENNRLQLVRKTNSQDASLYNTIRTRGQTVALLYSI